jgi:hypothetical protein
VDTFTHHSYAQGHGGTIGTTFPYIRRGENPETLPAEYHLYSLVLYTLRLRLSTPSTKGESSVACVLRHVLRNRLWALPQRLAVR